MARVRRHSARQTRGQSSQQPSVLMPCQMRDGQCDRSAGLPSSRCSEELVPKGDDQRDKFGDQLPNGGAHRPHITWETSDRAPDNESTSQRVNETSVSPIHVFSVSLGPANYGLKLPSTYERAPAGQPNREAPSNFELAGPSPVQSLKRSR